VAVRFVVRRPLPVDHYRRLYKEVGEQWFWHDRLEWSDEELAHHLSSADVAVWELETESGESAGFFELQRHDDTSVEIAYFGLVPRFFGRGLGSFMLMAAVEEAWSMGGERVWLHTCTLDSDRALPNYKARGFREYKTERLEVEIEGTQVVEERLLPE
jgi:ribosomal protein S18 acetylase RimI-like enzyme